MFIFYLFIFYTGACLASFLLWLANHWNQESIPIKQRSRCDHCQQPLKWYQLFPIFSILFFRFRCPSCSNRISSIYLISEIFIGLIVLIAVYHFLQSNLLLTSYHLLILLRLAILILMSLIDILGRWVPDVLQAGIFICSIGVVQWSFYVLILLILLLPLYHFGAKYIGGADIKLIFLLSLSISIQQLPLLLFISSMSALIFFFLYNALVKNKMIQIPFVPFLSLAYFYIILFN